MSFSESELTALADIATEILNGIEPVFVSSVGAEIEVRKGVDDYATTADLALERSITELLRQRTGIGVHGEEFGGADLSSKSPLWILDPIDGTANYLHGFPITGINVALLVAGEPVIGLTWLPFTSERYVAIADGPLRRNDEVLPMLAPAKLSESIVVFGNLTAHSDLLYPRSYRLALLARLVSRAFRIRMLGSSAVEMAWVAAGICGAAVQFGGQVWDVAPGICHVRATGGAVLSLEGTPYDFSTRSIVSAAPGVVDELAELFAELGDPASYE